MKEDESRVSFTGRRLEILEEMEGLLVEKGLAGFSMRRLAERVGISLASLQYHFPSKTKLLSEFLTFKVEMYREVLDAIKEDEAPRIALERSIRNLIELNLSPNILKLYAHLGALAASEPEAEKVLDEHADTYIHAIKKGIQRLRPEQSEEQLMLSAVLVVSLLEGFVTPYFVAVEKGLSSTVLIDAVVKQIFQVIEQ